MPNYGRSAPPPDHDHGEPSLGDILRSDDFIDALATGRQIPSQDDTDALLAAMLGEWRDEMRWPPEASLVSEDDAVRALNAGLAEKVATRRGRRGLSIVGSVAAAMLCIGGFGAVIAGSGPGDSLYGLRTMLFGAPKQVHDDQVVLTTKSELLQVQNMIAQGNWDQAQDKLVALSSTVESIGDQAQKQELVNQWNQLSARVVERNPEATVPPGITFTVPPSLNELVPTPAATTIPSMPPITLAIPSESISESGRSGTGTFSPSPSDVSTVPTTVLESSAPQSTAPETSPPEQTAPGTSGSAPSTTAAGTSAPSTTAAATSAPSTTAAATSAPSTTAAATSAPSTPVPSTSAAPTSAAPTTAAPTSAGPTSSAPAAASSTAAPTATSTAGATTSVVGTSAAPSSPSAATATTTQQPAAAAPSQATAQQPKPQTQTLITTTVMAPAQSGGA